MPAFAKKRPAHSPADLTSEILRIRAEIGAFIESKVAEVKASRDGQFLFVGQIRQQLTRGDDCPCRVVVRLLEEEQANDVR